MNRMDSLIEFLIEINGSVQRQTKQVTIAFFLELKIKYALPLSKH